MGRSLELAQVCALFLLAHILGPALTLRKPRATRKEECLRRAAWGLEKEDLLSPIRGSRGLGGSGLPRVAPSGSSRVEP